MFGARNKMTGNVLARSTWRDYADCECPVLRPRAGVGLSHGHAGLTMLSVVPPQQRLDQGNIHIQKRDTFFNSHTIVLQMLWPLCSSKNISTLGIKNFSIKEDSYLPGTWYIIYIIYAVFREMKGLHEAQRGRPPSSTIEATLQGGRVRRLRVKHTSS